MEAEEKYAACQEGYLFALRTHHARYGDLIDYSSRCMSAVVQRYLKESRVQKRCEIYNCSLDKPISHSSARTFGSFVTDPENHLLKADFRADLEKLDARSRSIVQLLLAGYTHDEAAERLKLSKDVYDTYIQIIRNHLKDYWHDT